MEKTCPCCGLKYLAMPTDKKAKVRRQTGDAFAGVYWECQGTKADGSTCNSTLFIPESKLKPQEAS